MKKTLSSLTLGLLVGLLFTAFLGQEVAHADIFDKIGDLFTTNQNRGITFEDFAAGDTLELSKDGYNTALTSSSDLREFIINIVNFALGFLGLIAVIVVIYGGALYVTAAGEEERTQTGKKAITYAVIGLLIILGSFAFVNTIIGGATTSNDPSNRRYTVGDSFGPSFNASSIQVRTIAEEAYNGFLFLAEAEEEIKNIINDSRKASLQYGNPKNVGVDFQISNLSFADVAVVKAVKSSDVLAFLNSTKSKLANIRSKVPKFSKTYTEVNNIIRVLERDIDEIKGYPRVLLEYEFGFNDSSSETNFSEGGLEIKNGQLQDCGFYKDLVKNCERYPKKLFTKWVSIQKEINDLSGSGPRSIAKIFKPMKEDYIKELDEQLDEFVQLKQSLSNIEAVQKGDLGKLYNETINAFGHKTATSNNNSLKTFLNGWGISNDDNRVDTVGSILFTALEKQLEFAEGVAKLQPVQAHLRANVTNGNAPLVVTFDVLDSIDPAGGTIVDANVDWSNIGGNATFDGKFVDIGNAVSCSAPIDKASSNSSDKADFGAAFRQCTFRYPGTYIATVKVKSNDPSKYVEGLSSLVIKVNPPTTKINLDLKTGSQNVPVISYYDNGLLKIDKDFVAVTLDEAKSGITFDATKTLNAANYKWDFGNSDEVVGTGNEFSKQTVNFKSEGKYKITLEVMSELGELDRKIFTLDVSKVAARIRVKPLSGISIGTPTVIDGTASSASAGKIKSYKWKLEKVLLNGKTEEINLGENASKSSFPHTFNEPGKYMATLTIAGDLNTATTQEEILVESKPPVALFKESFPDQTQPGTVFLDGKKSYDPDGSDANLSYKWSISPDSEGGNKWELVEGSSLQDRTPKVKFKQKGDYDITLRVSDPDTQSGGLVEEFSEITKTITVENVLDLSWSENQQVTANLEKDGKATLDFQILSEYSETSTTTYKIEFGDGDVSSGDIVGGKTITHSYTEGGEYQVSVTVYDDRDNGTTIKRRVFIGGGDDPLAKISLFVNGTEYSDLSKPIEVHKKDTLTFDASSSKNLDGTGRDLKYSWDFGDTEKSSRKIATHTYSELSPKNPGYFTVKLLVFDKDDPVASDEDSIRIKVASKPPKFSSIQITPDAASSDLVTPVGVNVRAFGVEDEDGEVVQYRWWYYDIADPDDPKGIQITQSPTAKITIGTNGTKGQTKRYGFGLEILDSDNKKASSEDILENEQIPTLEVINGENQLPTATLKVDSTKVFIGDKITFSSASKDPDGNIVKYIWDFEGDGFFNNAPTTNSTVEHEYRDKNLDGYQVRLKVIDDKGGEAISAPVRIFVDTLTAPPKAAFTYEVKNGQVVFKNNSTSDSANGATIVSNIWDFDTDVQFTEADSDGDGDAQNDSDSTEREPIHKYKEAGTYPVKLTVIDSHGAKDEVINDVKFIPGQSSSPSTTFDLGAEPGQKLEDKQSDLLAVLKTTPAPAADGIVYVLGTEGPVTFNFVDSQGSISEFIIDKNIYFDTNQNGTSDDDLDFKTVLPGTWKTNFNKEWGKIVVRLTVKDIYGNTHSTHREIKFKEQLN